MNYKKNYKTSVKLILISFILVFACLIFKESVYAWDWDGYYSGITYEEYNGDGTTDYTQHFQYRFTSNTGKVHINFIDAYNNSTISSYSIDVWGDASGLFSYGWNAWTAPNDINMAVYKTGGQDLGINFTNGSHVSTSRVMIDSRSPTDGMPYKQRFEASLRYNIPAGYTTNPSGWNSNNQGSLSLNENRYQSNGGRGGTIRQFIYTRNGRFDYWCMVPAPENPSTLTNSSFILTGALTSDVGLSTNFPGFYTTTSKILNIYLYRNAYYLYVYPNGGTWNGSTANQNISNQWGTSISVPNPTASPYTVTLNANGGSGSTTRTATRPFSGWTQSGVGTLSGTTFTFGIGNKTLFANYSTNSISLPTPTRTGYKCTGWYTAGGIKRGDSGGSYTPSQSETLYAQWTSNTYYIAFDGNGVTSGSMNKMTYKYDSPYALETNKFVKDGYDFTMWNTKSDGKGTSYTNSQVVNNLTTTDGATITLYAQWKKDITITYNANGGSGEPPAETKIVYNFTTSAPFTISSQAPTRTGYTFRGWSEDSNSVMVQYEPGTIHFFEKSTVLYAVWENNLGVDAMITRMLSPHEPVFKNGETGILTIHTTGFAEKVTVSFPTVLYPDGKYDIEYVLNSDDEFSNRESTFIIPLYCEEGDYIVTITAYRGEKSMTVYPSLTVEGTVLDDLKTRIRS